jgi:hypothetical protein
MRLHRVSLILLAGLFGPTAALAGSWTLDHVEFVNEAGADEWMGQAETRIQLLSHDNSQMAFRESWRTSMSQTYSVDWHMPDVLVPGEAAPFELSETCAESTMGAGWPFSTTTMTGASLVADWNTGDYMQVGGACIVGRTVQAPALGWTIPAGQDGDTTRVNVSATPTSYSAVTCHFIYRWTDETLVPSEEPSQPLPPDDNETPVGPPDGSDWQVPPDNTGAEPLQAPEGPVIARNGADGAVTAGVTRPATFQLDGPYLLTQIMTYHYGSRARPGTIALRNDDEGIEYGPWPAAGAGSEAIPNAYWWARPNVVIAAGHYTVIDSDPATWSREEATRGAGIFQLWGSPQ